MVPACDWYRDVFDLLSSWCAGGGLAKSKGVSQHSGWSVESDVVDEKRNADDEKCSVLVFLRHALIGPLAMRSSAGRPCSADSRR